MACDFVARKVITNDLLCTEKVSSLLMLRGRSIGTRQVFTRYRDPLVCCLICVCSSHSRKTPEVAKGSETGFITIISRVPCCLLSPAKQQVFGRNR